MTRALLRRLALIAGRVPRYLPVGEPDHQQQIRVTLEGLGTPTDVTHSHVMVALRPLTIALAFPAGRPPDAPGRYRLSLRVSPRSEPGTTLGTVGLRQADSLTVGETALQLFRMNGSTNACLPRGVRAVFAAYHAWGDWKRRKQRNTPMEPRDLEALQVLYICPRPVVLVTVQHGSASNLFPMDLIGQTDSPYFLLGLRRTSPSIRLIRESRRLTVSDVPLEYTAAAFQMGGHHEKERIDWSVLPFETGPSAGHGLPVLRDALRVRDLEVRDIRDVGSHTLFVTEVIREERRRDGLQMCFITGPYYRRLVLHGVQPPLPPGSGRT
jgi:flavin reductase (DIM6/NTAB) family NADH-FMN oxidoreductase RutF